MHPNPGSFRHPAAVFGARWKDRPHAELFTRQDDGAWVLREASGLDATIALSELEVVLALAELYRNVNFDQAMP